MTRKQQISFAATGYLVSLLYTYGISYSLIKVNNLEVTWITALLYTAVLLLIFSLIFYNKWTTIATVVVSLGYTYWAFRHGEALVWITDSLFPSSKIPGPSCVVPKSWLLSTILFWLLFL